MLILSVKQINVSYLQELFIYSFEQGMKNQSTNSDVPTHIYDRTFINFELFLLGVELSADTFESIWESIWELNDEVKSDISSSFSGSRPWKQSKMQDFNILKFKLCLVDTLLFKFWTWRRISCLLKKNHSQHKKILSHQLLKAAFMKVGAYYRKLKKYNIFLYYQFYLFKQNGCGEIKMKLERLATM